MIFLGLGSNIGDKKQHIERALRMLSQRKVILKRCSSFYQTEPWGIEDQEEFVNIVCEVAFEGTANSLLELVLKIEIELGRERLYKWGPRLIDIDLIEFHGVLMQTEHLTLPHPYYLQRDFVLIPLTELEPDWRPTGMPHIISWYTERLGPSQIKVIAPPPSWILLPPQST